MSFQGGDYKSLSLVTLAPENLAPETLAALVTPSLTDLQTLDTDRMLLIRKDLYPLSSCVFIFIRFLSNSLVTLALS